MSGGQHRVDEVTRTESRGLDRKNNPRIAAHRPPKETAGLRNAGVCAKGTKKESNTLDAADLVRDVAKSSSHQLSQNEISSDPCYRHVSLRADVLVQKLEDVGFPDRDRQIHDIVPIVCRMTDPSIYLQQMRLVHAVKLRA